MPVAALASRQAPSEASSQANKLEPGFGDVPYAFDTSSTVHSRSSYQRIHLTSYFLAFSATLTTPAVVPAQLAVVWTLILQSGSEGPSPHLFCSKAASSWLCYIVASSFAPSWRTVVGVGLRAASRGLAQSPNIFHPSTNRRM